MLVTVCGSVGSEASVPTEIPSKADRYVEKDLYSVPDVTIEEYEHQYTDL